MSIDGVGGVIYANQQIPNVASVVNSHNNRIDMQNVMAQASLSEKDEKVLEVRPAEENHQVASDREHEKNEAEQENSRSKKHTHPENDENKEEATQSRLHILDIKV
ncbi:hypothetical protein [Sulfurimonas sp.]|uniref:hypothetical protein n=1 Tax=Sulfurimonas sp. TaxID=2022749 RepID=UPI0025DF83A3|nr:hypothetical protein [Sulfurimonas sp.]MDD5157909.1 hypothetical protein [Sulfurimonas sp.]